MSLYRAGRLQIERDERAGENDPIHRKESVKERTASQSLSVRRHDGTCTADRHNRHGPISSPPTHPSMPGVCHVTSNEFLSPADPILFVPWISGEAAIQQTRSIRGMLFTTWTRLSPDFHVSLILISRDPDIIPIGF